MNLFLSKFSQAMLLYRLSMTTAQFFSILIHLFVILEISFLTGSTLMSVDVEVIETALWHCFLVLRMKLVYCFRLLDMVFISNYSLLRLFNDYFTY